MITRFRSLSLSSYPSLYLGLTLSSADPPRLQEERAGQIFVCLLGQSYAFHDWILRYSYNGFGGKVDPGETPAEAAVRELKVRVRYTKLLR